ncbi:hypothetical protein AB0L40_21025 [Patulibacter sp. NPDC049589]|uniref:hypothetical protein n=1 Tax=Patulibacter sp. NPDC049589 TaxID=3154731 RepID=UPI003412B913
MSRRRASLAGVAVAALAAVVVAVLLATGGGSGDDPRPVGPQAVAYARAWDTTCGALRTDAARTARAVRGRLAAGTGTAARRRIGRSLVAPYLGRTERRLERIETAVPPAEWRAYHRAMLPRLRAARERTAAIRGRVRAGDPAAVGALRAAPADPGPDAPEDLRRRTPACAPGAAA